jgi:AcrR family transcriptional regulator
MSDPKPKTKAAQRIATMQTLLHLGRDLFAQHGYTAVSMEELVQQAGVTRGALYHHFGSKEGLFRAVVELLQAEVAQRILSASQAQPEAWGQLLAGCRAFLEASLDPAIQRIVLVDAPAVLGWEAWRQMDEAQGGQLLYEVLNRLAAEGRIKPLPLTALHHLLSGAMNEAALWIAQADDPQQALHESTIALEGLLGPLQVAG